MVLDAITGLIPKIEGFAPLPSASADAFMSMQGGHMALYFGAYYTIGKRSIAKMTNEEFNLALEEPTKFTEILQPHTQEINNVFENYLANTVDKIQALVLEKAFDLEILKIHQNVKLLKELPSAYWEAIFSTNKKIGDATGGTAPAGSKSASPTGRTRQEQITDTTGFVSTGISNIDLQAKALIKQFGFPQGIKVLIKKLQQNVADTGKRYADNLKKTRQSAITRAGYKKNFELAQTALTAVLSTYPNVTFSR